MRSDINNVEEYLAGLPDDRQEAVRAVRRVILENLPEGYQEIMNWGMIAYEVPLKVCPDTYNGKPLMYAALASQKRHMAVYLTGIYMDEGTRKWFEAEYRETGKRMDMGKSCVRFRTLDQLPLPLVGKAIGLLDVDDFVGKAKAIWGGSKKK